MSLSSSPDTLDTGRHNISGLFTRSGQFVPVTGYVETHGDSLHIAVLGSNGSGLELPKPDRIAIVARDSVAAVQAVVPDIPSTLLVLAGVTALFLGALSFAALHAIAHEPMM